MSIRLMTLVFDSKLPSSEKFVLLAMADYASDDGTSIYPSVKTLSRKTSLSDRTVQLSIKTLMQKGILVLKRAGGGVKQTNLYKINVENLSVYMGEATAPIATDGVKPLHQGGETDARRGEATAPDPLLTVIEPLINNNCENFISKFIQITAVQFNGTYQVQQIEDLELLVKKYGEAKVLEMAAWCRDREMRNMNQIIRAIQTAAPKWTSGGKATVVGDKFIGTTVNGKLYQRPDGTEYYKEES